MLLSYPSCHFLYFPQLEQSYFYRIILQKWMINKVSVGGGQSASLNLPEWKAKPEFGLQVVQGQLCQSL